MHVRIYIYIHTYVHMSICTYKKYNIHESMNMHVCHIHFESPCTSARFALIYTYTYTKHIFMNIHVHMHVRMYIYIHTYVPCSYVHKYTYICTYVHIYLPKYNILESMNMHACHNHRVPPLDSHLNISNFLEGKMSHSFFFWRSFLAGRLWRGDHSGTFAEGQGGGQDGELAAACPRFQGMCFRMRMLAEACWLRNGG